MHALKKTAHVNVVVVAEFETFGNQIVLSQSTHDALVSKLEKENKILKELMVEKDLEIKCRLNF